MNAFTGGLDDLTIPPDPIEEAQSKPNVFVRTMMTPAGFPWQQRRSADLDARLGSPLPMGDVTYRIKRLEGWRFGAAARFAAFYVLARDVGERLEAHTQVDGREVRVVFETGSPSIKRTGRVGLVALVIAVIGGAIVLTGGLALMRRLETESRLQLVEQKVQAASRKSVVESRLKKQATALGALSNPGASISDVLADIGSTGAMKAPSSRIEAFHWDQGLIAVEARGKTVPFEAPPGQRLRRSSKPIRSGVWLWGLEKQGRPGRAKGAGGFE